MQAGLGVLHLSAREWAGEDQPTGHQSPGLQAASLSTPRYQSTHGLALASTCLPEYDIRATFTCTPERLERTETDMPGNATQPVWPCLNQAPDTGDRADYRRKSLSDGVFDERQPLTLGRVPLIEDPLAPSSLA